MRAYWSFVQQNAALLLFGFVCVFWGNFGQSFFLGWYGDAIKLELAISAQTYGALYSFATLCSALTVIWVGAWIDRWPLSRFVMGVAAGLFLACVLMANAHSIWALGAGFYCVRLFGQALLPHTGITTMARSFDTNRGKAMSLANCGVPVGEVVLPALAVMLMVRWGWQNSWWVIGASVPLVFIPVALACVRRAPAFEAPPTFADGKKISGRTTLFGDRRFWFGLPALVAAPFILTALFIHQGFVLEQKSWSSHWMAVAFVVYGVAHWLSSMLYGVLVDRFSGLRLFRFYLLPLLAAMLLLANVEGQWVAPAMMILLAGTIGASGVVVSALWAEIYGTSLLGTIRATVSGIAVFATALSPYLVGLLIDHGVTMPLLANGLAVYVLVALALLRGSYGGKVQTQS